MMNLVMVFGAGVGEFGARESEFGAMVTFGAVVGGFRAMMSLRLGRGSLGTW